MIEFSIFVRWKLQISYLYDFFIIIYPTNFDKVRNNETIKCYKATMAWYI